MQKNSARKLGKDAEYMYEYLLPIGSIVKIRELEKLLCIAGVCQVKESDPKTVYDYIAVPYPEGIQGGKSNFLLLHSDIEVTIFRGYEDQNREGFIRFLNSAMPTMPGRSE